MWLKIAPDMELMMRWNSRASMKGREIMTSSSMKQSSVTL